MKKITAKIAKIFSWELFIVLCIITLMTFIVGGVIYITTGDVDVWKTCLNAFSFLSSTCTCYFFLKASYEIKHKKEAKD